MCIRCKEKAVPVAAATGLSVDKVLEVFDAFRAVMHEDEARVERDAGGALSEIFGAEVRPYLLGSEPFVLLTIDVDEDGFGTGLSIETGGGLGDELVERVIGEAYEAWQMRETGGFTSRGTLAQPQKDRT